MEQNRYKKYTKQAQAGIKGEAFFESLIANYAIPHQIVGSKDLGLDFICEWVYGDKPTGILFGVQIKTFSKASKIEPKFIEDFKNNGLKKYQISHSLLTIKKNNISYWKGFGIPIFLFVIIENKDKSFDCFYKRFTSILTKDDAQEDAFFFKVNNGNTFIAFANLQGKTLGFARDLFIDFMRWNYYIKIKKGLSLLTIATPDILSLGFT